MRTTAWVAAAATAIALAMPVPAAADSIVLVGGHHWDAGDRGRRLWTGEAPGGSLGGGAGMLSAIGNSSAAAASQSVTINVGAGNAIDVHVGAGNGGGTVTSGNGPGTANTGGILQQVAPIAFTSTPVTPVADLGLTAGSSFSGTLLGALPLSGGGSVLLVVLPSLAGRSAATLAASADPTSPTPEPASLILLGTGLAGAIVRKRWFI